MNDVRVRFAPSPTGALHIGGARTALYNWLLARRSAGKLVLRIEDTDRERSTPENVKQILDALQWLELDWDEGPLSQFERRERHSEAVRKLLDGGHAYPDPATADEVRAYKREHDGAGYRGEAREGPGAAIRLRVPDEGETVVEDLIRGPVSFSNRLLDDFVIARADGTPLYNLAVAVDDAEMEITDVVRGDDHLSNAPKQLLVLGALGAGVPRYAHLPLLHGPDGRKLSKRHGAASAQELIERFEIERVGTASAIFDEQKLRWLNGRYMRELPLESYVEAVASHLEREGHSQAAADRERLRAGCEIAQEKAQTLTEVWPLIAFLFEPPVDDPKAWAKVMKPEAAPRLAAALEVLRDLEPFEPGSIETALSELVEQLETKPGQVYQPLRVAITGTTVSPGIFESLAALGREEAVLRIDDALRRLG